ncbi:MAG TPA: hypothetical protein VII69_14185 [Candidatus Eremiobacteraceae bacterium]
MRRFSVLAAVSVAAAMALLPGCSSGTAVPQKPPTLSSHMRSLASFIATSRSPLGLHADNLNAGHQLKSFYTCPATISIEYFSDYKNNIINVFAGKFEGQIPCGKITDVTNPQGLYVNASTHDLYVANTGGHNVLVFHRGETVASNSYTDPTNQFPYDVTMARDGTVIASNVFQTGGPEAGSISTWVGGPNGGAFVGNFPMTNDSVGLWITVDKHGTVYYNDIDLTSGIGALWSLTCPSGACGNQTQVAGVSFSAPGGLAIDRTNDLLANDAQPGTADTFELPNPKPKTFPIASGSLDLAIDMLNRHWFALDSQNSNAAEYLYPSGVLVGTVSCGTNCIASGIAVDP